MATKHDLRRTFRRLRDTVHGAAARPRPQRIELEIRCAVFDPRDDDGCVFAGLYLIDLKYVDGNAVREFLSRDRSLSRRERPMACAGQLARAHALAGVGLYDQPITRARCCGEIVG